MVDTSSEAVTLGHAGQVYLSSLSQATRREHSLEVTRFVRWFGNDRRLTTLRGVDIERYVNENASAVDLDLRMRALKAFLAHAKKAGFTAENLGLHVRVRRTSTPSSSQNTEVVSDRVEMTEEGRTVLMQELESLRAQRPEIARALAAAMADKDFRENAPLDAAREHQAHVEARIRELESMLRRALIVDAKSSGGGAARLGSKVRLRDLQSEREVAYILVGPGEVNAAEGKISISSPVGKALVDRTQGEVVEVAAPSRTFRYRIEAIEAQ